MKVCRSDMANKTELIHLKLRNNMKSQATESKRKELIKSLDGFLNKLISDSDLMLTEESLDSLIFYANNDTQNAIIQLGNLVLDNGNLAEYLKTKIVPGKNEYWSWLLRIMLSNCSDIGGEKLDWIIGNFMKSKVTQVMKKNVIECIVQMSFCEEKSSILAKNPQFLEEVYKAALSNDEHTYKHGFEIASNLVSFNDSITCSVIQALQDKLSEIIKTGFLKSQLRMRQLSSMILSNLVLNGFLPTNEVMNTVFIKSMKQRPTIIQQLSYFFVNASECLSLQLVEQVASCGMIDTLGFYLESDDSVLIDNGICIIKNIIKRLRMHDENGHKGFFAILERNGIISLVDRHREDDDFVEETLEEFLLA